MNTIKYDDEPHDLPADHDVLDIREDSRTVMNGSRLDAEGAERVEHAHERIAAARERFGPITG